MIKSKKLPSIILLGILLILASNIDPQYNSKISLNFEENVHDIIPKTSQPFVNITYPDNKTYLRDTDDYRCSYDFEDYGDFDGYNGIIDELDGHNHVLKLGFGGSSYLYQGSRIGPLFPAYYGTVEFYFRTEDASDKLEMFLGIDWEPVHFYVEGDQWRYWWSIDPYTTGSDIISLAGGYKPQDNLWHHVKIDFETTSVGYKGLSKEKWKLTVDGHSSGELQMWKMVWGSDPPTSVVIDGVVLYSRVNYPDGGAYFDAFGFSWDNPYYSEGDNFEEGLPLSFTYESAIEFDNFKYSLDGQANISIPGDFLIELPDYGHHTIQVFGTDIDTNVYPTEIRHFLMSPIKILTPNENSVWEEGSSYDITWISESSFGLIDIEIYKGNKLKFAFPNINTSEAQGVFSWLIPDDTERGTDWIVNISSSMDPTTYSLSDLFHIASSITIISPTSSSSWSSNNYYAIMWSTLGTIDFVDIELYNGTEFKYSIVNRTENDGIFNYFLNFSVEAGVIWRVKIIDSDNSSIFAYSPYFEIFTYKSFSFIYPNTKTVWERGTSQYITWASTGNISYVDIELFKGGIFQYSIVNSTENDWARFWEIPVVQVAGSDYSLKIIDIYNSSIFAWSEEFEIKLIPDIYITNPHSTSAWKSESSYLISWGNSARANISRVIIEIYKGFDLKYSLGETENDGSYLWILPYNPEPETDWYVKIIDAHNSSIFTYSSSFEIYTDKSVFLTTPSSSSEWAATNTYTITWGTTGTIFKVNLSIYQGTNLIQTFENVENDGSFEWTIMEGVQASTDWRIKISVSDYEYVTDWSQDFEIYIIKWLGITYPNSSVSLSKGQYYDLTWDHKGVIDRVDIELYKDGRFVSTLASNEFNDGRFLWRVSRDLADSSNYKIKIKDSTNSSVFDYSDYFFEIKPGPEGGIAGYHLLILILGFCFTILIFSKKIWKHIIRRSMHFSN
ncbi:MAG: hypothetical protein KGD65_08430 [Candidatus Lokiarchaeota archaeon]|nr:hypothetical protein [Candidatus Lokiarchaeota archaeon]